MPDRQSSWPRFDEMRYFYVTHTIAINYNDLRHICCVDMFKKRVHILNMSDRKDTYGKLTDGILKRIRSNGTDWAFTPGDFADFGDSASVGATLSRLASKGIIRRVQRGVYDVTHSHPIVGTMGASTPSIAKAIARRDGLKISASGAVAANELGFSTQVPARRTYGVAPRTKTIKVGKNGSITFTKRSGKVLAIAGRASGDLSEALRNMGRGNVSKADLIALGKRMNATARKQLMSDLHLVPAWMRNYFKEVAGYDAK
jgi:hypothetical protein